MYLPDCLTNGLLEIVVRIFLEKSNDAFNDFRTIVDEDTTGVVNSETSDQTAKPMTEHLCCQKFDYLVS